MSYNRVYRLVLAGSLLGLSPAPSLASGSSGDYGRVGDGFSSLSVPRDPFEDAFLRGRSQFKKRITCKTCAYPEGIRDKASAARLAERVRSGDFELDARQRADVMIFLQRRYGVTV